MREWMNLNEQMNSKQQSKYAVQWISSTAIFWKKERKKCNIYIDYAHIHYFITYLVIFD